MKTSGNSQPGIEVEAEVCQRFLVVLEVLTYLHLHILTYLLGLRVAVFR